MSTQTNGIKHSTDIRRTSGAMAKVAAYGVSTPRKACMRDRTCVDGNIV